MTFQEWPGGPQHLGHGTCFFIVHEERAFLVTNRHVLDPSYQSIAKKDWSIAAVKISGYDRKGHFFEGKLHEFTPRFSSVWDEDVACALVSKIELNDGATESVGVWWLDSSYLADDKTLNRISASHFVVVSGYPKWYDISSARPIMRSGIVSSDPSSNYCGPKMVPGARRIALEVFSSEGMSGSPVFALAFGLNISAQNVVTSIDFFPGCLVGILVGHYETEKGTENRDYNESGMSFVIKSTAILDLIA